MGIIYLFIYGCVGFFSFTVRGLSLVAASGGHSSSQCAGLSLSRPLPLRSTGSRRAGSATVAHRPSRSAACGILPDQGSNPCPLHWQADSQPLRHQGSPPQILGIRPHTSRTRNMIKSVRWLTLIKKFKHHFGGSKCEFTGFLEKEAIYIKQFFIVLCSTLCCVLYTANSTEKKTIQENKRAGYCKGDNWFWRPEESFSKPDARCWVNLGSYIPFSFTLRPLYLPF